MLARLSNLYFDEIIAPSSELSFTWEVVFDFPPGGNARRDFQKIEKNKHLSNSELFYILPILLLLLF